MISIDAAFEWHLSVKSNQMMSQNVWKDAYRSYEDVTAFLGGTSAHRDLEVHGAAGTNPMRISREATRYLLSAE